MGIETKKTKRSFNKCKHYLTVFNNAYFDKDHMWILYENDRPKLYFINNKTTLDMDCLLWI